MAVLSGPSLLFAPVLDLGNGHRAHFEIWDAQGSTPLDPAAWIAQ